MITVDYLGKKGTAARFDRQLIADIVGCEKIARQADMVASVISGYQVSVSKGAAYVQGDDVTDQGIYRLFSDAAVSATHTPDASNPRWDLIVARVRDSEEVGTGPDTGTIEIQQGTPSSSAALGNFSGAPGKGGGPAVLATAMPLWYVLVPVAGGIPAGNLVDARPRTSGYSNIAAQESITGAAFSLMPTPDLIPNLVVPVGGIIQVRVHALWAHTSATPTDATANLFLGGNQVQLNGGGGPGPIPGYHKGPAYTAFSLLTTAGGGLFTNAGDGGAGADVGTGTFIGTRIGLTGEEQNGFGAASEIFADPGMYDLSLRFAAASGTVYAKARQIWAKVIGPGAFMQG